MVNWGYIWFLPPTFANTHTHTHTAKGFPFGSLTFPGGRTCLPQVVNRSFLLLRLFTGTRRCLPDVALPSGCFDVASLVFTHRRDKLRTYRDKVLHLIRMTVFYLHSFTSCASIHLSENSHFALIVKRFSFSSLETDLLSLFCQNHYTREESAKFPFSASFLNCTYAECRSLELRY